MRSTGPSGDILPYRRLAAEVVRQAWLDVLDRSAFTALREYALGGDVRAGVRLRRHRSAVSFLEGLDQTLWGDCLGLNREMIVRMVRRKAGDGP